MRSKYNAKAIRLDGILFDSNAEAERYAELKILERAHLISELKVHPRYTLLEGFRYRGINERPIVYEADFSYIEDGENIVEDVKGYKTPEYNIKRKLFEVKFTECVFREVKA